MVPRSTTRKLRINSGGFVYSPEFVEGLGISLDWYKVEIQNDIGTFSAAAIANRCYTQGIAEDCALITRDFTGTLNGNIGEISNITSLVRNFKVVHTLKV